jgi:hypothetical protein
LIAGSWGSALLPGRETVKDHARIADHSSLIVNH